MDQSLRDFKNLVLSKKHSDKEIQTEYKKIDASFENRITEINECVDRNPTEFIEYKLTAIKHRRELTRIRNEHFTIRSTDTDPDTDTAVLPNKVQGRVGEMRSSS